MITSKSYFYIDPIFNDATLADLLTKDVLRHCINAIGNKVHFSGIGKFKVKEDKSLARVDLSFDFEEGEKKYEEVLEELRIWCKVNFNKIKKKILTLQDKPSKI